MGRDLVLLEIYLDNAATTRVDEDVAATALELMRTEYGNPSSLHAKGLAAQLRVDLARQQLASALGCSQEELYFTSGGTEANNLAILGAAKAGARQGKTLVAMAYEHSSVLEPLRRLETQGYTLRLVAPDEDGHVNVERLINAVDEDTVLLSCMLVNSEIGTIAPLAEIGRLARAKSKGVKVHTDAVQALGKIPFSIATLGVDLASVSAHKICAPKGIGALYVRKGVRILPRAYGGGQERGVRPGTENTPMACAFGHAAEKMATGLEENLRHAENLRSYFVGKAREFPWICINSPSDGTPYICNIAVPGHRSEILLHYLAQRNVYVSSGSACSRGAASHVLRAMKLPAERVDGALRISFSKDSTREEVDQFFAVLEKAVEEILPARRGRKRQASGRV